MSVFSDNVTITGDGSNSTTLALATKSVTNIADMQNYAGPANVIQVADPYQGGTFHYDSSANSFISESLTFNGAKITLSNAHPGFFKVGQTIYITGTSDHSYDGEYLIKAFNGTVITVSPAFVQETANATISVLPFKNNFAFSYASGTVTIFNLNFAKSAEVSFLANEFYVGQTINVTGTKSFNKTFTIDSVTDDTITALVSIIYPATEFTDATLTDSSSHTGALTFNSGGTAPTTINDTTDNSLNNSGFRANQSIQVSGTQYNNGQYKILSVSQSTPEHVGDPVTSQLVIVSAFPVSGGSLTANITVTDGGLTFQATNKGSGMWRRQFDPKDGLNVTWFGAKGNAFYKFKTDGKWYTDSSHLTPANDDTASIQRALNVAAGNRLAINKVVIPPGMYLHSTLYVPAGVLLTGGRAITESLGIATSRLVMKAGGGDSIRVTDTGVDHATTTRNFWYGGITNLEFLGEPTNKTGWAISFSNTSFNSSIDSIAPQDMNFFENLQMRNYPEGGINFPDCAVPLNVRNIKAMFLGGPAIFVGNGKASGGQSINLDNVSCDHNVGGGIWLDKLDDKTNVIITNLKSEGGNNTSSSNLPDCQRNAVICSDCSGTPVIIDNANHQNVSNVVGTFIGNPQFATITSGTAYSVTLNVPVSASKAIRFYTTGKLPNRITAGTAYYPLADAAANIPFQITTDHVNAIKADTSGDTESGIHLLYQTKYASITNYEKPGDLVSIEKLIGVSTFSSGGTITLPPGAYQSRAYQGTVGLSINDIVKFYPMSASPLPANIIPGKVYYVNCINSSLNTIKIATAKTTDPAPVVIDTSIGDSTTQYRVYKQIDPLEDNAKVPKINWRGAAIRVRTNGNPETDTDKGVDPLIVAKTTIPYTVSEGKLNITQQIFKSNVTFAPSSSLSTPINLVQGTQPDPPKSGDFWYDGTTLRLATSPTTVKSLPLIMDVAEQTYTGTIAWNVSPSAPAGAPAGPPTGTTNHSYQWTQVGKMVTVRFNLSYQNAATTAQMSCYLPFPSDLPAPNPPTGFSGPYTTYAGSAGYLINLGGSIGVARCNIHKDGAGTNRLDISFTGTVLPLAVLATITYWIA